MELNNEELLTILDLLEEAEYDHDLPDEQTTLLRKLQEHFAKEDDED